MQKPWEASHAESRFFFFHDAKQGTECWCTAAVSSCRGVEAVTRGLSVILTESTVVWDRQW